MADPICRWRNATPETICEIIETLPKEEMTKDDFRQYMLASKWGEGFAHTIYQFACQTGLYYIDDNDVYHPRFRSNISIAEANNYLKHWFRRYYVPNPYTKKGFANLTKPLYVVKTFEEILKNKNIDSTFSELCNQVFKDSIGELDIFQNAINKYSGSLKVENNRITLLSKGDTEMEINVDRNDKKAFFDNFNEKDQLNTKLNYTPCKDKIKSYNRIIFGAPGTGKSFQLKTESQPKDSSSPFANVERVTFHPDYSYGQFVGSYKPVSDDDGRIRYEYVPGPFMRTLVKALESGKNGDSAEKFLLIVEEINRAKVASVFGDMFQLLDRTDDGESMYDIQASEDVRRYLAKELGGTKDNYTSIKIPNNMYIWATMNSADQGVFPMDTAFKRRWDFEYIGIDENAEKLVYDDGKPILLSIPSKSGKETKDGITYDLIEWNKFRTEINRKLSENTSVNEDKLLGPFFISLDKLRSAKDNPSDFIKCIKSKILMYLFEDVVKISPAKLFKNCGEHPKYSDICSRFDEIGAEIFGISQESIITPTETAKDE